MSPYSDDRIYDNDSLSPFTLDDGTGSSPDFVEDEYLYDDFDNIIEGSGAEMQDMTAARHEAEAAGDPQGNSTSGKWDPFVVEQ